ncbi:MAG: hypothetical protein GC154_17875 [bacterium]|nr:hypothetical protein [bacterium]
MNSQSAIHVLKDFSRKPEALASGAVAILIIGLVWLFPSEWMLLGVLGAFVTAVAIYYGYEYFPLALFLTIPFSIEFQIADATRITLPTEALIPFLTLLWIGEIIKNGKIRYRPSMMNWGVFMLYSIMIGSLFYTYEPVATIKACIRDTGYILAGYYLIPRFITSRNRLATLLFMGGAAQILLVVYGLGTQAVWGVKIYGDLAYPFFIEHCIYAAYIVIAFAFFMAYMLEQPPGPVRNMLGALTALIGMAILLTFVRAAWISVFFLLLFYLIQFRHKKSSVDLILLLIYLALIGFVVLVGTGLGEILLMRIETISDFQYVANYERIGRWVTAWKIWTIHPWFGTGWGSYPDQYFDYVSPEYMNVWSAGIRMGAHNLYLELLAETGVCGLFVYLIAMYIFFREALLLQSQTRDPLIRTFLVALQGAMLTYLIHAFLNNLGPSDKIGVTFWCLMGMLPACRHIITRERMAAAQ